MGSMKLFDLPVDTLCLVTAHLHSLDVENLWMSGVRALNTKLANGGLAGWNFSFNGAFSPFSVPHVFQVARLTNICLKGYHNSERIDMTVDHLAVLPNTVRFLDFSVVGAFTALQQLLQRPGQHFPVLESLAIGIYLGEVSSNDVVVRWPQSISTLILTTISPVLFDLDLSSLPPQLETLDGDFYQLKNPLHGAFPSSLTSLKLRLRRMAWDPVPLLPSGLRLFSIAIWAMSPNEEEGAMDSIAIQEWAERSICKLPRSLTSLSIPVQRYGREELNALPQGLTALRYKGRPLSLDLLQLLPRSLVRSSSLIPTPITKHMVEDLPRHLDMLYVESNALPYLNPLSETSVEVVNSNHGLEEEMKGRSMSPLILSLQLQEIDFWPWQSMPKNLRSFFLDRGSLTSEQIGLLPRTLKELIAYSADLSSETDVWKRLPPGLEVLSLSCAPSPYSDTPNLLPKTLKHLILNNSPVMPMEWFSGLPDGLQTLEVPFHLPLPESSPSPWQLRFPTSLTTIKLSLRLNLKSKVIPEDTMRNIFSALPKHLEELSIAQKVRVPYTLSDLSLLPNRLGILRLPTSTFTLSEVSLLVTLPRALFSVTLGGRFFTGIVGSHRGTI